MDQQEVQEEVAQRVKAQRDIFPSSCPDFHVLEAVQQEDVNGRDKGGHDQIIPTLTDCDQNYRFHDNLAAMKLGFEETQTPYDSGSQSARFWTEKWVEKSLYCPNCGSLKLDKFPNNRPAADFLCSNCQEEFELKSQKTKFGAKVVDGAYRTMCERVVASNNPNFLFMNYSLQAMSVVDLFIVPKHFFVPEILEKRKPLAETARRAGWIGCNILLSQIPLSGKIFFVRNTQPVDKELVLSQWQRTLFLRDEASSAKGWLLEVMKCVESIGKPEFDLDDVYAFERRLKGIYPNNQNIKPKIRQQLQFLRDQGYLDFVGRGNYRLRSDN